MATHVFSINLGALSNDVRLIFQAPLAAHGGGIRVLSAAVIDGGTPDSSLALLKYSAAGTPAVNGTLATAVIGGTASQFVADVPKAWTIDDPNSFVAAGEWIVISEGNVEALSADNVFTMTYWMGK